MDGEQTTGDSTYKEGNPFNQAGLTTLIIGVGSLAIRNPKDEWYKTALALVAPFISYFFVWVWVVTKRGYKQRKYCSAIENQIKLLREENSNPDVQEAEKTENQQEIFRLKKLLSDTTIKQFEIN